MGTIAFALDRPLAKDCELLLLCYAKSIAMDAMPSPDQTATRVLLGALMMVGILLRFHYGLWVHAPRSNPAQIRDFVRRSSRLIYLFFYGLLLCKLLLNRCHGVAMTAEGLQPYFFAAIVAQFLIRALGYGSWLRSRKPADSPRGHRPDAADAARQNARM